MIKNELPDYTKHCVPAFASIVVTGVVLFRSDPYIIEMRIWNYTIVINTLKNLIK